jgi:lysophospholipase L1-like esterase
MKSFLKFLRYSLFILLVTFVSLEIILRIYNPFPTRLRIDKIILPVNQHVIIKNSRSLPFLENTAFSNKNSLGFRGPEKPVDFDKFFTLVTVGGSSTECYYLSDSLTWPALLGSFLSRDIPDVWVNNAGLDGHSTFGHQILLDDYLVKLKPKFILFLVGCNDVGRQDLSKWDKRFISRGWKGILEKSEVVVLTLNLWRVIKAKREKIGNNYESLRVQRFDTITYTDGYCRKMLEDQKPYLQAYRERLRKLVRTCLDNGIRPILVTQPSLFGEGVDDVTGCDLAKKDLHDGTNGKLYWERLELYNDVTREVCRENQIILVDLAHELPKSYLYLYDAVHFNVRGAKKVANILYHELIRQPEISQYIKK